MIDPAPRTLGATFVVTTSHESGIDGKFVSSAPKEYFRFIIPITGTACTRVSYPEPAR